MWEFEIQNVRTGEIRYIFGYNEADARRRCKAGDDWKVNFKWYDEDEEQG